MQWILLQVGIPGHYQKRTFLAKTTPFIQVCIIYSVHIYCIVSCGTCFMAYNQYAKWTCPIWNCSPCGIPGPIRKWLLLHFSSLFIYFTTICTNIIILRCDTPLCDRDIALYGQCLCLPCLTDQYKWTSLYFLCTDGELLPANYSIL